MIELLSRRDLGLPSRLEPPDVDEEGEDNDDDDTWGIMDLLSWRERGLSPSPTFPGEAFRFIDT